MLSRLLAIPKVILHGTDGTENTRTYLDPEVPPELEMDINNSTEEDVWERLAYTQMLVVELEEIIKQKDEALEEERHAADNKIKEMKWRAKAKLTSWKKQKEMKDQEKTVQPPDPQSEESFFKEVTKASDNKIKNMKMRAKAKLSAWQKHREETKAQEKTVQPLEESFFKHDKNSTKKEMKIEEIKYELQEKEKLISSLQAQLTQAEQAAQIGGFDKSCTEMEEFVMMKKQLQEKEELINTLQEQLSQTQVEQAAQKLKMLQRKLEEHEEALLGHAQVVDLLQQELTTAEQKNQNLSQKFQQMEAEHHILRNTMETERQEFKVHMEKMELEVAERELSFHNLQEEVQHFMGQIEQASQAQAELESRYSALKQKHKAEIEEKTSYILNLQKTEQELQSTCDALKDENSKLLQDKNEQAVKSAQAIQQLEDQLQQKSEEINQFLNKPTFQKHETAIQTYLPGVSEEVIQAVTEETIACLQKRVVELDNEKGALLLSSLELEELKSENEKLSSQITLLKAQNKTEVADSEVCEISMIDTTIPKKSGSSIEESGQDVLENTFSQNHKELSVLLLEMKEAQEEIAFVKSQLQGEMAAGHHEIPDQKKVQQMEGEGIPPVGMQIFLENTAQDFPLVRNEESSVPVVEKEEQANTELQNTTFEEISLNDTGMGIKSSEQGDTEKSPSAVPDVRQCHEDEAERLKSQILELETSFRKAEEIYEKNSEEKAQEISSLTQLIEEFKKNAEDTSSVLSALSKERDQLLSQVKELNVLTELRAQVKQRETNLSEAERQRRPDCECQTTQHNLFTEQMDKLSIEAKSKDLTIEALQKELDDVQLQFSEQSTLMQSLQNQLHKKEREVLEGAECVRGISSKMEELSQALSQKELEIAQMDQLLLEKKRDVETLQQTIEEKDQQVTEISFSMTEKMVQLNDEKCSLSVEIKTLKEQLNLLSSAEEAKKEQVQKDTEVISGLQHNYDESSPAGLVNKEELQHELDRLKKESELRKKQLRAALISRKDLIQRVSILEEELAKVIDKSRKEIPLNESERREMEEDNKNKEDSDICVPSKCQEVEISLKQTISEKEMELQPVRKDLEEKIAAEAQLQAVVQQMNQNLQDKANQIDLLQAEITDKQAIIQKLTTGAKDAGDGDCTTPIKETAVSSPPAAGSGEHWKPELEERILELEKEKEILQKKFQGALTSRKTILKKAQEKERYLREELKREKDNYNRLQEQFDEQSKENEDIEDQLKQLQIQLRESIYGKLPGTDQQELHFPAQGLFQATDQYPIQPALESDLCPRLPSQHGGANTLQGHTCIAQIKAHLKAIEAEKDELKLKVNSATSELTTKSEEVFELKEQINQQIFEIQSLRAESHETEAHTQSLLQKLESSQLEIAGLEHLRALQPKLDELQNLISQKEEEVSHLSGQLSEKEKNLSKVQTEVIEQEDLVKALHTQLEMQAKEHEGRVKQLQVEICELKQKPEEIAEENKAKQLTQRTLQAALISRKQALKTNKGLQEELSLARDTIKSLTKSLADVESQVSIQNKEKDTLLGKLALLQEERDRLITKMDRSLLEKQNLSGFCESLKLALEGLTEDKENLVKEIESLRCSKIAEGTECQEKNTELQKEYEIFLQAEEKHLKEKNMQEKLDTLHREKVHLEETLGEIHITLNKKDKEVKQLQENLDNTVAQLATFTKSMSSLQDDRDRVIDEAKKWERKFGDAIQTKEEEIRLKEENCNVLRDQLRQMSIHMEELKINISRLEHDKQILEFKAQTEVQHQQKVCDVLQGENKELFCQLEETQHLYYNSQNELTKLESELKILRDQSTDLNNSLEKYKEHKETLEGVIKQQEADIQNCKFKYEQLETDLQASRELTSRLQEEINLKEHKILSLLSGKEQEIHVAVTELHQQYDKEIKELENLSQEEENKNAVDKTNQLMETSKTMKKENIQQKAQLDPFVKSRSSLQNDRDHIVSDYQQLEERHLSTILEKDQLTQEAAAENNKLKEEIRGLRSHMDDLNSENAKLDAELIQYREDLNQVISIKDTQQKQLFEELRHECVKLEENIKDSEEAKKILQMSSDALRKEKEVLCKEIENLKISISQLNRQEEDTLGMYRAHLKEEEVQRLNAMLFSSQKRITELEVELVHVQKEATRKVGKIEDKLKKELKHLHHDAGIMRNETETAQERVAELSRYLVEMEQKLLVVTKENKDLTAQIQSFGMSMNSLQNSRDHAKEELDELKRKYDASLKELAQLREQKGLLHRESDALLSQTAVHLNSTEENSFSHLEKLNQQLISKDEQLLHLSSQLEDSYNQVQSFSKAMASLQNERDHLWSELEKFRKSEDGKQRSAAQSVSSPTEVQSLKKVMSSLQNDRDRLLKELENLQQQYLKINQEITELRPLKAQLQEYQDKTKTFQIMQEQLWQENLFWQHELHQLSFFARMQKNSWTTHERRMQEQYLMAISYRDQQLSYLQGLLREFRPPFQTQTLKEQYQRQTSTSVEGSQNLVYETELLRTQLNDSLKDIYQKELRIQQLNSKFSQLLEEKNTLSIQLSDTSQSLHETQQHYSELFNHCAFLEKQVQELWVGLRRVDVAPRALQEKNGVHRKSDPEEAREPQQSFSETQQQLCNTKQEVNELRKLLEKERVRRTAAENALSLAEAHIRRWQH